MTRWSIAPSDSIAQIGERERGWGEMREGARERNTKRIEMPANILRQTLRGDSCTLTATPSFANICRSPSTPETRAISRSATTSTLASCHTPCPRSLCVISHARTRCVSCARALSSMVRVRALHQAKETAASSAHVVTHKTGQHAQGKTCTASTLTKYDNVHCSKYAEVPCDATTSNNAAVSSSTCTAPPTPP